VGTWLQLWLGFALCGLAKGPPGWVTPIAAGIGAWLCVRRGERARRLPGSALGFLLAVGLVLAWAIPVDARTGGGIFRVALGKHVIDRAGGGVAGHGGWAPWWFLYYFGTVLLSFFPWSLWFRGAWRRWRGTELDPRDRTLLGWWIGGTFLVFTLVIGKRPHYVMPILPALAVLVGGALATARSARTARLVTVAAGAVVVLFFALMFGVLPQIERQRLVPRVARKLAEVAPPGARRIVVDFRPDGLTFYSQRDADGRLTTERTVPLEHVTRGKEIVALLRSGEPVAVVLTWDRRTEIRRFQGLDRLPGRLAWQELGWYAKKSEYQRVAIYVAP
jgi:4-amino-4-deoxy-L-arabinose transferase-like glycosyltransferase